MVNNNVALCITVISIVLMGEACANKHEKAFLAGNVICDSAIYAFPNSGNLSSLVDSVLEHRSVSYCTFRFSYLSDTANVIFIISDSSVSRSNNVATNRYFRVGKRIIPVFSYEDFFFRMKSAKNNVIINDDSESVNVCFTYPELKIVYVNFSSPR